MYCGLEKNNKKINKRLWTQVLLKMWQILCTSHYFKKKKITNFSHFSKPKKKLERERDTLVWPLSTISLLSGIRYRFPFSSSSESESPKLNPGGGLDFGNEHIRWWIMDHGPAHTIQTDYPFSLVSLAQPNTQCFLLKTHFNFSPLIFLLVFFFFFLNKKVDVSTFY